MNLIAKLIPVFVLSFWILGCSKAPETKTENASEQVQEKSEKESRQKAKAGVGKRGQKLKDHNGPLATPVKAYFKAQQQLVFMNAQRALQMYEIQHGFPRTHEEYMEKIIRANNLQLPELPEGQWYEYDPETHELMVIGSPEGS